MYGRHIKCRLCAQTQQLYIIKTFYMSQVNQEIAPDTSFSVQLPYIAGPSFKPSLNIHWGHSPTML